MFSDDFHEKFDRFTLGIIRRKVKQLITRAGFTPQDREDLEQELFARVLQSLPSFDPGQAHRNKFITAVVERYVANILRDKRAGKRDHRRICSLNITIDVAGEGPIELAETISRRELDARLGGHPRSDEELAQLACDIAEVMGTLPDELRDLAERLRTESVSEIARATGVPRTTLNESVRRLRRRFERAGLKDYL
ncbi:MAG: sigma-70 family RNA polymerase sigma factor [Hyphomicrobiaceae bacterium]